MDITMLPGMGCFSDSCSSPRKLWEMGSWWSKRAELLFSHLLSCSTVCVVLMAQERGISISISINTEWQEQDLRVDKRAFLNYLRK